MKEEVSTLAKVIVEVIDVIPKLIHLNVYNFSQTSDDMSKCKGISTIF